MSFDEVARKTTIYGISDFNQIPADVPAKLIPDAIRIRDALRTIYEGSPTAKAMFDRWISAGKIIQINGEILGSFAETLPGLPFKRYQMSGAAGPIDAYQSGGDLFIHYGLGDWIRVLGWKDGDLGIHLANTSNVPPRPRTPRSTARATSTMPARPMMKSMPARCMTK
jgi:hypothetical protein